MTAFEFFDGHASQLEYVVLLQRGIKSKEELFTSLAKKLEFPAYFGHNWDALDECLADLSWIDAPRVTILHEDLPLVDASEQSTYLDILESSMRTGCKPLRVMFPSAVRERIERISKNKTGSGEQFPDR